MEVTNFDNYVKYILEDNPEFNEENVYFKTYTKMVNSFETKLSKKISHFSPDELLDCMEKYGKGTRRSFRSFLTKYFSYLVIKGEMEVNYIQYDERFKLKNLEGTIKFTSKNEFYEALEYNDFGEEKKVILLALFEGLEARDIAKIKRSSIQQKNISYAIDDDLYIERKYVLKIDENEIVISQNLAKALKSLCFVETRHSKSRIIKLIGYKDYVLKLAKKKEFENDEEYEDYQRKAIIRYVRKDILDVFNSTVDELRISGLINFLCSFLKKEDFQKNKINIEKIQKVLNLKGYVSEGFYWVRAYQNAIEEFYNNQGY